MEPSKSEIKGFFKQKKTSGISKSKSSSMAKKKLSSPKQSASYGSDITQPAALVSHGSVDLKGESTTSYLMSSLHNSLNYKMFFHLI